MAWDKGVFCHESYNLEGIKVFDKSSRDERTKLTRVIKVFHE